MDKRIVLIMRWVISALFLLSAIAKLYPVPIIGIEHFEKSQLATMFFISENLAPYVSRFIIGIEFFIAIAILQNNYLKRIVIPISILLVTVFSLHLSYEIFLGVNDNCGCFGELIPMTPIQAILKNILTLIVLFFLYKNLRFNRNNSIVKLVNQLLIILLLMFVFIPMSNGSSTGSYLSYVSSEEFKDREEKKILCFFEPGCDHCQRAARSLDSLAQKLDDFPPIHIIFADLDNDTIIKEDMKLRLDNFFNFVGSEFPYQTLPFYLDEVVNYYDVTNSDDYSLDNPVVILYDGRKPIRFFDGSGENEYNVEELKRLLE